MNESHITSILAITSLAFSAGAVAQNMPKSEYNAAEKNIKIAHGFAKKNCVLFADNAEKLRMKKAMEL